MTRCNSGYSLMELLVVISLMGVVMTLFGRVVVTSVTIQGEVHDAAWSQDRVSQTLRAIRADVWSAESVEIEDGDVLALRSNHETTVRWSAVPDASFGDDPIRWSLRREVADGVRVFILPELQSAPMFRLRGTNAVGIEIGGASWWLSSEHMRLVEGGSR
ncbi:MAG: type II secretion system protein [Planctomycetota bacterium]